MQNSHTVGQLEQTTGKIENQGGSNLHGYDVSGNAHMTSAFTVTKNKFLLVSRVHKNKYVFYKNV